MENKAEDLFGKCENPLHNIQVQADGRCHWCEGTEPMEVDNDTT